MLSCISRLSLIFLFSFSSLALSGSLFAQFDTVINIPPEPDPGVIQQIPSFLILITTCLAAISVALPIFGLGSAHRMLRLTVSNSSNAPQTQSIKSRLSLLDSMSCLLYTSPSPRD